MLGEAMQYLWVPVVLVAAAAQTVRNTAQRSLTAQVGTLPATLVRFLYGLPFAAVYLLALYGLGDPSQVLPKFSVASLPHGPFKRSGVSPKKRPQRPTASLGHETSNA